MNRQREPEVGPKGQEGGPAGGHEPAPPPAVDKTTDEAGNTIACRLETKSEHGYTIIIVMPCGLPVQFTVPALRPGETITATSGGHPAPIRVEDDPSSGSRVTIG